ncbi:MAG: substrate-binding domain-containing protein [Coprococcus sp.]
MKTQIEEGAPADIFISAAMKQMNELNKGGFMKKDSIVKLLENKVVLDTATGCGGRDSAHLKRWQLTKYQWSRLEIHDVPVGQYTEQIYKNLGLWDQVAEKGESWRQMSDRFLIGLQQTM